MARRGVLQPTEPSDQIKRLTLIALFSDDDLLERLVLKGGNALALGYGLDYRVSADIDLSMPSAFAHEELTGVEARIRYRLEQTFRPEGWEPFDLRVQEKPAEVTPDLAGFWGGYSVEFKLIDADRHRALGGDLEAMRRHAQVTGPHQRKRVEIDISRHEQCDPKRTIHIDGYTVYVYAPLLLACEKLRAICQQLPEYDRIVRRERPVGTARPRDFLDLHTLLTHFRDLDLGAEESQNLLAKVFAAKRVPLSFLGLIRGSYDQHHSGWSAVRDTVRPGFALRDFHFYFDFVVELAEQLHPGRDM
jgi:hypothetical protein